MPRTADALRLQPADARSGDPAVLEAGFRHEEATIAAMRVLRELETMSVATRMLCSAPEPVLRALLPLNPTMIFLLRRGA